MVTISRFELVVGCKATRSTTSEQMHHLLKYISTISQRAPCVRFVCSHCSGNGRNMTRFLSFSISCSISSPHWFPSATNLLKDWGMNAPVWQPTSASSSTISQHLILPRHNIGFSCGIALVLQFSLDGALPVPPWFSHHQHGKRVNELELCVPLR